MTDQVTIQAPNAPATGKQWGLIRHLAHEAGFKTATEAVIYVLGSYTKGALTRELASTVIIGLQDPDQIEAGDGSAAIEPPRQEEPANRSPLQAFRDGWTKVFTPTPQIDPLPCMAVLGLSEPATSPNEPELDLAPAEKPSVAVQCGHWGTLQVREIEPEPDYPDEIEHEIRCGRCGAQWAQVEAGNPHTIQ